MKIRRTKGPRKLAYETIIWTAPDTEDNLELHRFMHGVLERKGYKRVDKVTEYSQYSCDGDVFEWREWNAPGGRYSLFRHKRGSGLRSLGGFWDLYEQAHVRNYLYDAFNPAGA